MQFARYFLLMGLLATALTGCGFKLRTQSPLPESMQHLVVTASDDSSELYAQLAKFVERSDLNADDTTNATAQLHLISDNLSRRTLSLFSNGQVAEQELIYTISYAIKRDGEQDIVRTFELTRNYQDDPDNALAKSREIELILSEMRGQATRQIIRELSQLK